MSANENLLFIFLTDGFETLASYVHIE